MTNRKSKSQYSNYIFNDNRKTSQKMEAYKRFIRNEIAFNHSIANKKLNCFLFTTELQVFEHKMAYNGFILEMITK